MHTLAFGVGAWGHFVVAVLVRDMARYPLLAVALALIYAILFGRLADGLGIPKLFKLRGFPDDFFTAVLLEFEGEASLSWYLSKTEQQALEECATSQEVDGKIRSLAHWWRARV